MADKIIKLSGDRQWNVNGTRVGGGDMPEDALRIWTEGQNPPPDPIPTVEELKASDSSRLDKVLQKEGSIERALIDTLFEELNRLRATNGQQAYNKTQFVSDIADKMRT